VTLAHGHLGIPKLLSLFGSPELHVALGALRHAHGHLADTRLQVQAVSEGLVPKALALLDDDDDNIRQGAVLVLGRLAGNAAGRVALDRDGAPGLLLKALDDPSQQVRTAAWELFVKLTASPAGAKMACSERFVPVFVALAREMLDENRNLGKALEVILNVCRTTEGGGVALEYPTLPVMVDIIQLAANEPLQEGACRVVAVLALYSAQAKVKAVSAGAVAAALDFLEQARGGSARGAAAAALMAICVDDHAKAEAYKLGCVEIVAKALERRDKHSVLDVVKLTAILAHHPPTRAAMVSAGVGLVINEIKAEEGERADLSLLSALDSAAHQVAWKP
jgi:hypothetical protein